MVVEAADAIFFFEQGMVPKDQEVSLDQSGRITFYKKGLKQSAKHRQVPTIYTKDLKRNTGNTIKACSFSTANRSHSTVTLPVAGDETTWGGEGGASCTVGEGPPLRLLGLEVENDHLAPAGDNRHGHERRE